MSTLPYQPASTLAGVPTRVAPASAVTGLTPAPRPTSAPRELVMLVLDVSGSMGEPFDSGKSKLDAAKNAAIVFALTKRSAEPDDEVGIVEFDDRARCVLPLTHLGSGKQAVLRAVQSMGAGGGTDIDEALRAARDHFQWDRAGMTRRVVLLTDGHGGSPLVTAGDIKSRGALIEVVGVGTAPTDVDERLLRAVASTVRGEVLYRFVRDARALVEGFTRLATRVQTRVN